MRSSTPSTIHSRVRLLLLLAALAAILAACAPGPNPAVVEVPTDVAGFWQGLWHGIIAPVTFFISLFTDRVNIYEVVNSGNWYDFGFVLGAGILFGGSRAGGRRS
jgi:hypothetical protein